MTRAPDPDNAPTASSEDKTGDARAARLAAALRDNLKRRKAARVASPSKDRS